MIQFHGLDIIMTNVTFDMMTSSLKILQIVPYFGQVETGGYKLPSVFFVNTQKLLSNFADTS